jgi:hypothetical protein
MVANLSTDSGGPATTVRFGRLTLLPEQKEGKLVFVFDGGYQSMLPAANYIRRSGLEGSVAVIGKYVDYPTQDHLNVYQLKMLQNQFGWDIVNHTQEHVGAYQHCYQPQDLAGYAADIVQQAVWLEANGLNSAPNWLIYGHGSTNAEVEQVVSRYYMFGHTVVDNPDAYPYGEPHAVANLEIQSPRGGEGGDVGYTPPSEVLAAVNETEQDHMTIVLTFHRIRSEASDPQVYPLSRFKEVVNGVLRTGIKVMALSQLDQRNGVPVTDHIYMTSGRPPQLTVSLSR